MATIAFRWLVSRTVRQAMDMCRQARKMLNAQRDVLLASAAFEVAKGIQDVRSAITNGATLPEIRDRMEHLEKTANQNLHPYPSATWRENIEVLLVTGAIVLAFRTFFFQPMAIPTGSAQPTLWGIHSEDLRNRPDVTIPTGIRKWIDSWWSGIHYYHVIAEDDGELTIEKPRTIFPFVKIQTFRVGNKAHTVWFAPDDLAQRAGLDQGQRFRRGQDILKLKVVSGDHLFVNCMIYNFCRPERGDIIVFHSTGILRLTQDTHYIKRLVALGGDHVRIGNDRHLVIDGNRLDASTPRFENVYSFDPKLRPEANKFSGHVNDLIGQQNHLMGLAPLFRDQDSEFVVRKNHYLALGDNTMNSYDGRAWGDFPREKVIGRASFVFWPITERFGWGYR